MQVRYIREKVANPWECEPRTKPAVCSAGRLAITSLPSCDTAFSWLCVDCVLRRIQCTLVLEYAFCGSRSCSEWRTERGGQVVNITLSYSGGPELQSRPRRPAMLIASWFFSVPSDECQDGTLKLGHESLLPSCVHHSRILSSTLLRKHRKIK